MEELPPVLESPPEPPPPPAMSLAARLLNVFAIPGEVFTVVKVSRVSIGNWALPMLLSAVIGAVTAIVIVSQPVLQKQMHDRLDQQTKTLEQQVKAGKLKQVDADRTVALTRFIIAPPTLKLLGGDGGRRLRRCPRILVGCRALASGAALLEGSPELP